MSMVISILFNDIPVILVVLSTLEKFYVCKHFQYIIEEFNEFFGVPKKRKRGEKKKKRRR